jgi:RNA polymerase sigma-70 factor, ECF subfamily
MTGVAIEIVDHQVGLAPTAGRPATEESFAAEVLCHRRGLITYAHSLTRDRVAADDLLQDTFERAFRCAWQFQEGTKLAAWLRRIMRNLFTDSCRLKTRFISIEDQDAADRLLFEADTQETPAVDYRQFVTLDDIESALLSIDRSLKDIFVRAHLKRQTYQTIAVELGIPVSTVGTRLWRARARLRGRLAEAAEQT